MEPASPTTTSQSPSQKTSSDSFEDAHQIDDPPNGLFVEEDHFSVHSDIDFLEDVDLRSNLSREESIELAITRYTACLNSLSTNGQLSGRELEEKKRKIVRRICDLKVKLAKLREEEEFEDALKEQNEDGCKGDPSEIATVLFFKRTYSFVRHISGHKLVLSTEIIDNEKRLRSLWKSQLKATTGKGSHPTSPVSLSPTATTNPPQFNFLSQTFPTSRLLQLLSNTSNHLSNFAGNWAGNGSASNPFAQLVCDQCLKRSTKSLNDYLMEAIKFTKKSDGALPHSPGQQPESVRNNPYLVCIYCFFTIHLNCLCQVNRKCPKLFFDDISNEGIDEQHSAFYNAKEINIDNKLANLMADSASLGPNSIPVTTNRLVERHQKRMRRVILKICPEVGLAKQDFRCGECKVLLSPTTNVKPGSKVVSKARQCDYTGLYFCENCHINDTAIIPARVIHNWDFRPQPVSRVAYQIISYLKNTAVHFDRPVLFNLVETNPMLYGLVDELIQIKRLRSELCQIFKYISLCKQPSKPRQWVAIMCQLGPHLLSEREISYLSFTDICDLKSLSSNLSELEHLFISHINSCESCHGKGFFCELCPNKEDVLFPFSPNTTTCSQCYAVYHKNCYFRRNRLCPRCNRIKGKFALQQQQLLIEQTDQSNAESSE